MKQQRFTLTLACLATLLAFSVMGCGAGSARDPNETQAPKLDGGRLGLSAEERIQKIKEGNMSEEDKQARIAKIQAESSAGK